MSADGVGARRPDVELPGALSPQQRSQLALLVDALLGDAHAPTAIAEREEAWRVHVADSLAGLEVQALTEACTIADLGAGAGFPGLALAVALPHAEVRLVESRERRCEFLARAVAAAGIGNARVVCARVEEWRAGVGANDAVTARALASQAVVLEYAAPLLRLGGTLVEWRGGRDAAGERRADVAAQELGLTRVQVSAVTPYPRSRERHLHVFVKDAPTPERFPRRPGIARKRPLGGAGR